MQLKEILLGGEFYCSDYHLEFDKLTPGREPAGIINVVNCRENKVRVPFVARCLMQIKLLEKMHRWEFCGQFSFRFYKALFNTDNDFNLFLFLISNIRRLKNHRANPHSTDSCFYYHHTMSPKLLWTSVFKWSNIYIEWGYQGQLAVCSHSRKMQPKATL